MRLHPLALSVAVAAAILLVLAVERVRPTRFGRVRKFGRLTASILAAAGLSSWPGWAWLVVEALALPERLSPTPPPPRLLEVLDGLSWLGACVTLAAALREVLRAVV